MRTRARQKIRLYPIPGASKQARRWMEAKLTVCGRLEWLENSLVVTSELVTNAIRHTGKPFTLVYSEFDDLPWIEVCDQSPQPPTWHAQSTSVESGRGLKMVARLSVICGHSFSADAFDGKIVYSLPIRDKDTPVDIPPEEIDLSAYQHTVVTARPRGSVGAIRKELR
ncbi:ATP-binding protein [Actinoallomurus sp. NPDC052274]|uniref:ATP-binding protein n=1 Tax=Actinoallomurus sp. NPDC052274 TaxID=3155420 RepID=UPI00344AF6D2